MKYHQADIDAAADFLGVDPRDIDPETTELVDVLARHRVRGRRVWHFVDLLATGIGQGMGLIFGLAISFAIYSWWTV